MFFFFLDTPAPFRGRAAGSEVCHQAPPPEMEPDKWFACREFQGEMHLCTPSITSDSDFPAPALPLYGMTGEAARSEGVDAHFPTLVTDRDCDRGRLSACQTEARDGSGGGAARTGRSKPRSGRGGTDGRTKEASLLWITPVVWDSTLRQYPLKPPSECKPGTWHSSHDIVAQTADQAGSSVSILPPVHQVPGFTRLDSGVVRANCRARLQAAVYTAGRSG
ncbi:hypothetical protein EDB85DRAFT_2229151 [Lactarius pseudohatsudake]|nr:hypothetical protein EDB85DRAFT_2229151 [Lactarius pseudohatsudake]